MIDALEIRPDSDGKFDEIVARFADGIVHVETMSKTGCYVGFYWDDGRYCQWWIGSKGNLTYSMEHGHEDPPRFTAQGVDRKPELGAFPYPHRTVQEIDEAEPPAGEG